MPPSLSGYYRALLQDYSDNLGKLYSKDHVGVLRRETVGFMLFLQDARVPDVAGIGHRHVMCYCDGLPSSAERAKDARIGHLRIFLVYLAERGIVRRSLALVANRYAREKLVVLESLPVRERDAFITAAGARGATALERESFYTIATGGLRLCLDAHGYSSTTKNNFAQTWADFYLFLDTNGLDYSLPLALHWVDYAIRPLLGSWRSYRRSFRIFEQFIDTKDVDPGIVYSYRADGLSLLPEWSRQLLEEYLSAKAREGNAKSTMAMQRSSCLRFLNYLESCGVTDCSMMTPQTITDFHVSDPHASIEGKNAYGSRVRQFLDHLAEKGLVPQTLRLAIPASKAREVRIVETLDDSELEAIRTYRSAAATPMELRDIAMVLLGLRMGLRGTDIVNLRLRDISWENQELSFVQAKTGVALSLPLPAEVANCLYRYIMRGRPESDSLCIFVAHKVPFQSMQRGACRRALDTVLSSAPGGRYHGFHVTRKTFASRMLSSEVPFDTIADALGHRRTSSVFKYLATDEAGIRQCAIPLSAVPLSGRMLT